MLTVIKVILSFINEDVVNFNVIVVVVVVKSSLVQLRDLCVLVFTALLVYHALKIENL